MHKLIIKMISLLKQLFQIEEGEELSDSKIWRGEVRGSVERRRALNKSEHQWVGLEDQNLCINPILIRVRILSLRIWAV